MTILLLKFLFSPVSTHALRVHRAGAVPNSRSPAPRLSLLAAHAPPSRKRCTQQDRSCESLYIATLFLRSKCVCRVCAIPSAKHPNSKLHDLGTPAPNTDSHPELCRPGNASSRSCSRDRVRLIKAQLSSPGAGWGARARRGQAWVAPLP